MEEGKDIDWATAEALAMGSLLYQGITPMHLDSGQSSYAQLVSQLS